MTPVEPMSTCEAGTRSRSATCLTISRASLRPRSPLQTFEQPLFTRTVCSAPPRACSMDTSTGAPFTWLVVNTAAERAGDGAWISARSFRPLGLMPAATPPARMPGTAVTPPSSHSMSTVIDRAPRARVGHRGDVTEIRASHGPRGGPLAVTEHADEGLARVELAVDVDEV